MGSHGDAGQVARALLGVIGAGAPRPDAADWTASFRTRRAALLAARDEAAHRPSDRIQPARLYAALRATAPADTMFTMDAGTLCLQATDQLPYLRPPALFTPSTSDWSASPTPAASARSSPARTGR